MAQPPSLPDLVLIDPPVERYTLLAPLVKSVRYENPNTKPEYRKVWDINDHKNIHWSSHSLSFGRQTVMAAAASPEVLADMYFPDSWLIYMATKTNSYAKSRLPPSKLVEITPSDICYFLAMYYYMGIVRLPSKDDYWRSDHSFWPVHPPALNIRRDKFMYIWRNLHFQGGTSEPDEEADIEEDGEEEEDGETQEVEDNMDETDEEAEDLERDGDSRWYAKVGCFLDHIGQVARKLCLRPGSYVSIDEMMKRFKGRSGQTHRMKNKPIKEGYKFFALCDTKTGYVYHMEPDGRLDKGSTHDYVMMLANKLPDTDNYKYVIGMDNYFTWPKVMQSLTDKGIGVVGTARASRGWPPKEFKDIKDERFNTVYVMNDIRKYRIMRWVDNNVVTMVSNVHDGNKTVNRNRKRPRQTATNWTHLQTVWGSEAVRNITIPKVIDDYNHWMCGVDKADQLIAYYRPNLRCRRTWMPLFSMALMSCV
jgi:hypothetical protein